MSTSTDGRRHAAWLFDPQDLICKDGEDNTWDCTYVDASLVDTVYIYEYNRASKSAYWCLWWFCRNTALRTKRSWAM